MFEDPPGSTNCINLIEEDEAGLLGPRHLKELPHHPRPLTHVPENNYPYYTQCCESASISNPDPNPKLRIRSMRQINYENGP
jgi:hypothetical protein